MLLLLFPLIGYSQEDLSIQTFSYEIYDTIYVYPEDNAVDVIWGASEWIEYGEGAVSIKDGEQNTSDIVGQLGENSAAYICDTLTAYGYDDWYLPSFQELNAIFYRSDTSWHIDGIDLYWSSSGVSEIFARGMSNNPRANNIAEKSIKGRVRCIRK